MKRWLILMTKENLAKCESGAKEQTRRDNPRLARIKKGDHIYYRSNYKTTYEDASGPYLAEADAEWQDLQDITAEDAIAEGIAPEKHLCGCEVCARTSTLCPASASSIIMDFRELWDSIYKREGATWDDNPRVLKIAFRKMVTLNE